jgi:hypothetical protein
MHDVAKPRAQIFIGLRLYIPFWGPDSAEKPDFYPSVRLRTEFGAHFVTAQNRAETESTQPFLFPSTASTTQGSEDMVELGLELYPSGWSRPAGVNTYRIWNSLSDARSPCFCIAIISLSISAIFQPSSLYLICPTEILFLSHEQEASYCHG